MTMFTIDLSTVKVVLAVAIFVMGLGSVLLPQRLTETQETQHWFSLGNMAASGVLLAGGLVHLLPDSAEVLNGEDSFPMANFICGLTFMGFLVLEESLHMVFMTIDSSGGGDSGWGDCSDKGGVLMRDVLMMSHDHGHSHLRRNGGGQNGCCEPDDSKGPALYDCCNGHSCDNTQESTVVTERKALLEGCKEGCCEQPQEQQYYSSECKDGCCSDEQQQGSPKAVETTPLDYSAMNSSYQHIRSSRRRSSNNNNNCCDGCHHPSYGGSTVLPHMLSEESYNHDSCRSFGEQKHHHHHHHEDHIELHLHGSVLATGVLMLALSIHATLAGVSIGIETSPETIASTALAILAHKSFEGFCLGASFVSAGITPLRGAKAFWTLCVGFALATPVGILVGAMISIWASESSNPDDSRAIGIIQAMVAGTFLYISIVEIGSKELLACRHDHPDPQQQPQQPRASTASKWRKQQQVDVAKLVCFVAGYCAMASLALVV